MSNIINKVEYNGNVLIDLTSDTVTANDLVLGITCHAADGTIITGTAVAYKITKNLTNCSSNIPDALISGQTLTYTVTADSGYELPSTVTVTGCTYTWNSSTRRLVLINATSNVEVTITGEVPTATGTYKKISDDGTILYLRGTEAEGYTEYNVASGQAPITGSGEAQTVLTSVIVEEKCILPPNCSTMFIQCENLLSIDTTKFDTRNVTNMNGMFANCYNLTSINVLEFNTSNVTDMSGMFWGGKSLTSLDLSNFNTSNVTDMSGMFRDTENLSSINLSTFDTSNVTDMSAMFFNSTALTNINLSGFNTSKITSMVAMFRNCSLLTSIDISNFDTSKVTSMSYMFYGDTILEHIYAGSGWNTDLVTSSTSMFYNDTALHNFNSSYIDKTKAIIDDGTNGGYLESL